MLVSPPYGTALATLSDKNGIIFFLIKFGKEYTRHAEIVKEVKQRNDDIYWKMMVGRVILSLTLLGH